MSIGYPDGQRVQNWDGPLAYSIINQRVPAVVSSAALDVSRYAAVAGQMWASIAQAQITFQWYADKALGTTVGVRTINLDPNIQNPGQYLIPNMGPWLQVTVSGLAGSNPNVYLTVTSTNRQRTLELLPQFPAQIALTNDALAASTTNLYFPLEYVSGPVNCTVTANQAWTFRMDYLNNLGVWSSLVTAILAAGAFYTTPFLVPLGAWRCQVQNNTATATTDTIRIWQSGTGST